MEIKKSEKASLENKKLLFTEIGLVVALGIVWAAFEHSSKDAQVAVLEDTTQVLVEEEMVAIQNDTPPPPPEAPNIPVLSDQIDIVDDDIKLDDDMFMNLEDDNTGVEIMDYKEAERKPKSWKRKSRKRPSRSSSLNRSRPSTAATRTSSRSG